MEHLTYEPDRSCLLEEFTEHVNKNGGLSHLPGLGECHLWIGAKDKNGYGRLNINKWEEHLAHRWIFKLTNPSTFDTKCTVNHRCNRGHDGCVNPSHLYQVPGETFNASNIAHAIAEKRLRGQVFTFAEAMIVRAEIAAGAMTVDLCDKYHCSKQTINDIKFNRTHKI